MRLKGLEVISLLEATKEKQDNGCYINGYKKIANYNIKKQVLQDEVSSSMYGARINSMYRLSSPLHKLEKYLQDIIEKNIDNISKYYIQLGQVKYKIVAVKSSWIDIERL